MRFHSFVRQHWLAFVALFFALGGVAYAVPGNNVNKAAFVNAGSVTLTDAPGGSAASAHLLSFGRISIDASCDNNGGGQLTVAVSATASGSGAFLLAQGPGQELQPNEGEPFIFTGNDPNVQAGINTDFAVLDAGGTSGSGVAAAEIDPANSRCVVTAHAVG